MVMLADGVTYPVVGYVVTTVMRQIEVDHPTLDGILTDAGLIHLMPRDRPSSRVALRRAIAAWVTWRLGRRVGDDTSDDEVDTSVAIRTGRGLKSAQLIRLTANTKEWLVFALVTEQPDIEALALQYATEVRFFLNKTDGRLLCSAESRGSVEAAMAEANRISREIEPFWERYRGQYRSSDISRIVVDALAEMQSVSVRDRGGVYFVPDAHAARLSTLGTALARMPTRTGEAPVMLQIPVPNIDVLQAQIRQAAEVDLQAQLDAAETDLTRFEDKTETSGTVRQTTVQARLAQYARLREQISLYVDTLGVRDERMTTTIDDLDRRAQRLLGVVVERQERAMGAPAALVLPMTGIPDEREF